MISVGVEAMNAFSGTVFLNLEQLIKHRDLNSKRFENLLMKEKSVALPYEDTVTYAVNAAKPIIDNLSEEEKNSIEMVIACTETGIDFGKSISTYIHDFLGLNRNCRLFEVKQACYGGTVGLQMAVNFILSQTSPGAKALVIASDVTRFILPEDGQLDDVDWSYAEPSAGAGAVAFLVSDKPYIFQIDVGANGYYGYEVMDSCRPIPDSEAGSPDLSLLSYLDCYEQAFLEYKRRVKHVDYENTFNYLAFHIPFGGLVKGAHRNMMRKMTKVRSRDGIEKDFEERVMPGMLYCQRVGNIMAATSLLSIISAIDNAIIDSPKRIGCFSYGSGCCGEFFSGVVTKQGQEVLHKLEIKKHLDERYQLSMDQYEMLLKGNKNVKFGTRNIKLDMSPFTEMYKPFEGKGLLYLDGINEYHRVYRWL